MGPAPFLTFPRRFALKVFFAGLNPSKNLWSGLAFPTPSSSAIGGDEQIRTVDPLLARQVLSQLSYTPRYYRGLLLILAHSSFQKNWWAQVDSNHRPRAYQARALTA